MRLLLMGIVGWSLVIYLITKLFFKFSFFEFLVDLSRGEKRKQQKDYENLLIIRNTLNNSLYRVNNQPESVTPVDFKFAKNSIEQEHALKALSKEDVEDLLSCLNAHLNFQDGRNVSLEEKKKLNEATHNVLKQLDDQLAKLL
jgi:hypothetical protein